MIKKEGLSKRSENFKNKNEEQLETIKNQGQKQLKELKIIDESKTLKSIGKITKKMMKQINYYLNLGKQMRHLITQNSFRQKLMELNMTLIGSCFH